MRTPAAPLPGSRPLAGTLPASTHSGGTGDAATQGAAAVPSQDVTHRLEVYGRRPRDPAPTVQEAAHRPKVPGEPLRGPAPKPPGLG
jgi:hypothetical protein